MFFKQCLNKNITRIMNSQLNTIRNMNTNINKKLDYIIDKVWYDWCRLYDILFILNK